LVTDGVALGVTGIGKTFEQAIALAHAAIDKFTFKDVYRRDIGHRVKSSVSFSRAILLRC